MIRQNYHTYRSYGHSPWGAFVLGTSIWWWVIGFPVIINVLVFGSLYLRGVRF